MLAELDAGILRVACKRLVFNRIVDEQRLAALIGI
jgi:hypothetical protein